MRNVLSPGFTASNVGNMSRYSKVGLAVLCPLKATGELIASSQQFQWGQPARMRPKDPTGNGH